MKRQTIAPPSKIELNARDIVSARSGGPKMIVVKVLENGKVLCEWLGSDRKTSSAVFDAASLKKL